MKRRLGLTTAALLLLLVPGRTFAAGFSIFEAGAKALGMGGAFTAQADDPSTIFYNVAGLADLDRTQVYFGTSLIFTGTEFSGVDPSPGFGVEAETGTQVFPPSNAYITHSLGDNAGIGFGFYNAYGLGQDWKNPETFPGRHISHDVLLETFWFNPAIAARINDYIAIGGGVQMVYSTINPKRYLREWDPNGSGFLDVGTLELDGSSRIDLGFNAGLLVTPGDDWRFGVAYHGAVNGEVSGTADFNQIPSGNPAFDAAVAAGFPADQRVSTTLNLPWLLSVGTAYDGIDRWRVTADFNLFGWSRFKTLPFRFTDSSLDSDRPQDYENSIQIRTGFEYGYSESLALRAGYYWDETPQPVKSMSPFLGDASRHAVSAGFGYSTGEWTIDGYGVVLITSERSTEGQSTDGFNGTYRAYGSFFGVNFGYSF